MPVVRSLDAWGRRVSIKHAPPGSALTEALDSRCVGSLRMHETPV